MKAQLLLHLPGGQDSPLLHVFTEPFFTHMALGYREKDRNTVPAIWDLTMVRKKQKLKRL